MSPWLWFALLSLAAIVLLWLAFRGAARGVAARDARNTVFRDRARELDADLAAGKIDAARHADARRELEDALALELADAEPEPDTARGRAWTVPVVASAVVVGVAWLMYAQLGTPHAPAPPAAAGDLGAMVERLAARMEQRPDDLDGWMLLGRSRMVIGDYPGAVDAWRAALRMAPDDPTVLANLAEAMVVADPSALRGDAAPLLEHALTRQPDNPKALWYGGLLAEARGDDALAVTRWRALLAQDPPSPLREMLEERVGADAAPAAAGFSLDVTVEAGDSAPLPAGFTLFVTLHDAAAAGGPPLAAVRRDLRGLPATVTLTDAAAMLPGTVLADRDALRVTARVSASGEVIRRSGDLVGEREWRPADGEAVRVTLDRVHD